MTLKLAYWDDPWLRKKVPPVTEFNDEFKAFVKLFLESFQEPNKFCPGATPIGLASTQVRSNYRLFAICPYQLVDEEVTFGPPELFINPELSEPSDLFVTEDEGCLSFPKLYIPIERPDAITVEWQDIDGNKLKKRFEGFVARQIMHENDHLNGVLFIDRISKSQRKRIKNQLDSIKNKY